MSFEREAPYNKILFSFPFPFSFSFSIVHNCCSSIKEYNISQNAIYSIVRSRVSTKPWLTFIADIYCVACCLYSPYMATDMNKLHSNSLLRFSLPYTRSEVPRHPGVCKRSISYLLFIHFILKKWFFRMQRSYKFLRALNIWWRLA